MARKTNGPASGRGRLENCQGLADRSKFIKTFSLPDPLLKIKFGTGPRETRPGTGRTRRPFHPGGDAWAGGPSTVAGVSLHPLVKSLRGVWGRAPGARAFCEHPFIYH